MGGELIQRREESGRGEGKGVRNQKWPSEQEGDEDQGKKTEGQPGYRTTDIRKSRQDFLALKWAIAQRLLWLSAL